VALSAQQVGLLGDRRDQLHHVADAAGGLRQRVDARVGLLRLRHRLAGDARGLLHLRLISFTDEVISSVAVATDCTLVGGLLGSRGDDAGQLLGDFGGAGQRAGGASSSVAAVETVSTMPPTGPWN
jgi:hypothetical protein